MSGAQVIHGREVEWPGVWHTHAVDGIQQPVHGRDIARAVLHNDNLPVAMSGVFPDRLQVRLSSFALREQMIRLARRPTGTDQRTR